jgi:hypothetical protein
VPTPISNNAVPTPSSTNDVPTLRSTNDVSTPRSTNDVPTLRSTNDVPTPRSTNAHQAFTSAPANAYTVRLLGATADNDEPGKNSPDVSITSHSPDVSTTSHSRDVLITSHSLDVKSTTSPHYDYSLEAYRRASRSVGHEDTFTTPLNPDWPDDTRFDDTTPSASTVYDKTLFDFPSSTVVNSEFWGQQTEASYNADILDQFISNMSNLSSSCEAIPTSLGSNLMQIHLTQNASNDTQMCEVPFKTADSDGVVRVLDFNVTADETCKNFLMYTENIFNKSLQFGYNAPLSSKSHSLFIDSKSPARIISLPVSIKAVIMINEDYVSTTCTHQSF